MAYDPSYNIFSNTRPTGTTVGGTSGGSTNPFIRNGGLSAGMVDPNWLRQQQALAQPAPAPAPVSAPMPTYAPPPPVPSMTALNTATSGGGGSYTPSAPQQTSSSTTTTTETGGGPMPSTMPSMAALNKVVEPQADSTPEDAPGLGLSLSAIGGGAVSGNQEVSADQSQLGVLRAMARRMPADGSLKLNRRAY